MSSLNWSYRSVNGNDPYALLNSDFSAVETPAKEYTFLCAIQRWPLAVPPGSAAGQCGNTGALPHP